MKIMKLLVLSNLLISSLAWSASSKSKMSLKDTANLSSISLRDQAAAEAHAEGQVRKSATDAQVASAMLSLKDPRPEIITRTWLYFAGFTAQSFQARGSITTDSVGRMDLSQNSSTFMPGLVVGIMSPAMPYSSTQWRLGLRADASFASQNTSITFPSGYTVSDARLNSTLLSVGPTFSLQWQSLPWVALTLTPQYGNIIYTQTASNDFAQFSKQSPYLAWNYGVDFQVAKSWSVFTEYSQRKLLDSKQEIALQNDNFELGTKVTW